jgi:hypothetical protein
MARGQIEAVEVSNGFQGGLNTEANPLTFPPNCSIDELNFTIEKDGSRRRRKGIVQVTGSELGGSNLVLDTTGARNPYITNSILKSYHWPNAGYSGINIWIIQNGNILYFYNNSAEDPMMDGLMGQISIPGAPEEGIAISHSVVMGRFVIAYGASTVAVIDYNQITADLSLSQVRLTVRDLWGVDDGLENGARLNTLSNAHLYNLRNQGWPVSAMSFNNIAGQNPVYREVLSWFKRANSVYPANSDLYHFFLASAAEDNECISTFNPWLATSNYFGSTEPFRGRYIIDVFNRGGYRQSQSGVTGIPSDITYGGISVVGSYAGRVFYAFNVEGVSGTDGKSPNLSTMVFYSKVIKSTSDMGACYGSNDPTAPDLNDPLATDGGFISIPDIGKILNMTSIGQSMFIIAENGVWEVNGGDSGFSATNLNLGKVTNTGAVSASAIVTAEGIVFYWGRSGIYALSIDPVSMRGTVQNITEETIKQRYMAIPSSVRLYVTGIFLPEERQVRWLYSEGDTDGPYMFDRELIYDMGFNAFTLNRFGRYSFSDPSPFVFGYLQPSSILVSQDEGSVLVDDEQVVAGLDDVVYPETVVLAGSSLSVRYAQVAANPASINIVYVNIQACIGEEFLDWFDSPFAGLGGVDYDSYLLTGAYTGGDTQKFPS